MTESLEPEPQKRTSKTPHELQYMIEMGYTNWEIGISLPEEVGRLVFSSDPFVIQGIRDNLLSYTEKHAIPPQVNQRENISLFVEELEVDTAPPALDIPFHHLTELKNDYIETWCQLSRLDAKRKHKSDSTIKQYANNLFTGEHSLYQYCAETGYDLDDIRWPTCRRSNLINTWIADAEENPVTKGMRINSTIIFLKYVKHAGVIFIIPVEDAYLMARREI